MKIEKETFKIGAAAVGVIAKEMAVSAVTCGITTFGAAKWVVVLGMDKKHPILGTIYTMLSAGLVSGMVMGNEKVQEWIFNDAGHEANRWANIIYGPSDEEEVTED